MNTSDPRVQKTRPRTALRDGADYDLGIDEPNNAMTMSSLRPQQPTHIEQDCLALANVDVIVVVATDAKYASEV